MKVITALIVVFLSVIGTYGLVAKFSYSGRATLLQIMEGSDINVPYNDKYGLLGYAYARDYYENGRVVERRNERLNPLKLAVSSFLVSLLWLITGAAVLWMFRRAGSHASDP